jgi:hypothetical protein
MREHLCDGWLPADVLVVVYARLVGLLYVHESVPIMWLVRLTIFGCNIAKNVLV